MKEQTSTRRSGRKLAGMLAAVLGLALLPLAAPASAQPRDIAEACPADEVPDFNFTDVNDASTHADAINCVAYYGITLGTGQGNTYNPGGDVDRDQMASFIVRLMDYVAESDAGVPDLPAFNANTDENLFPCDVSIGTGGSINPHYVAINRLALAMIDHDDDTTTAEVAIVQGGPGGIDTDCYGPGLPVTRAQMASFIHRAEMFLGVPIPGSHANAFSDDENSVHEDNINAIAAEDIAAGLDEFTYNPGGDVQRDQMASFLARKLDYLVEHADVDVTPPNPFALASVTPDEVEDDEPTTVSATVSSNVAFNQIDIAAAGDSENACTVDPSSLPVSPDDDEVTFDLEVTPAAVAGTADETCSLVFTITFDESASTATTAVSEEVDVTVTDAPAA